MILATAPVIAPGTLAERGQSLFGLIVFIFLAFLLGRLFGAKKIAWRVMIWGVILQFAFGAIVIYAPSLLEKVQYAIDQLLRVTVDGAKMVFGNMAGFKVGDDAGLAIPVMNSSGEQIGLAWHTSVFAFVVLPTIIFISMLTAMLYHIGVLTWVVKGLAWIMQRTMGTSGAETLSTAANIFVGQTEAPLVVRPFLLRATKSELMAIMVGGFSNIASGVLVVYAGLLKPYVENAGGHLAAACFISAPATLIIAKLLLPETEKSETISGVNVKVDRIDLNIIDSATRGTSEGLQLAINVGAMLISFTALIFLINAVLSWGFAKMGYTVESPLQEGLGYVCSPLAWLCGIPWSESHSVGSLLGIKTALNEFIAYESMKTHYAADPTFLSPRSGLLATYALCGFANIASVGIQIGGISVLAPERRHDLSKIGFLAMIGGAIASCMGACVVGVLM